MPDRKDRPADPSDQPTVTTPGDDPTDPTMDAPPEAAGPTAARGDECGIPSDIGSVEVQEAIVEMIVEFADRCAGAVPDAR